MSSFSKREHFGIDSRTSYCDGCPNSGDLLRSNDPGGCPLRHALSPSLVEKPTVKDVRETAIKYRVTPEGTPRGLKLNCPGPDSHPTGTKGTLTIFRIHPAR